MESLSQATKALMYKVLLCFTNLHAAAFVAFYFYYSCVLLWFLQAIHVISGTPTWSLLPSCTDIIAETENEEGRNQSKKMKRRAISVMYETSSTFSCPVARSLEHLLLLLLELSIPIDSTEEKKLLLYSELDVQ